jgi:hypothetical protein
MTIAIQTSSSLRRSNLPLDTRSAFSVYERSTAAPHVRKSAGPSVHLFEAFSPNIDQAKEKRLQPLKKACFHRSKSRSIRTPSHPQDSTLLMISHLTLCTNMLYSPMYVQSRSKRVPLRTTHARIPCIHNNFHTLQNTVPATPTDTITSTLFKKQPGVGGTTHFSQNGARRGRCFRKIPLATPAAVDVIGSPLRKGAPACGRR